MIIIKIQAGLGNQLFQYATGRSLSIKFKTELRVDLSFYENPQNRNVHYRLDKFNLPFTVAKDSDFIHLMNRKRIPLIFKILKQFGIKFYPFYKKTHLFEGDIMNFCKSKDELKRDYYVEGWLANENYFKEFREIIVKEFNADDLLGNENIFLQHEIINSNSIAVHIRRGDYLTIPYFKTLSKEYYLSAMRQALDEIDNPIYYFFSDDITWAKEQFSIIQNTRFIENNSVADTIGNAVWDIADLMLMRSCKHQIIANSSFSWWGAWLNENPLKKVYFPAHWYNDAKAQKQFKTNSFIPSGWIKIQF